MKFDAITEAVIQWRVRRYAKRNMKIIAKHPAYREGGNVGQQLADYLRTNTGRYDDIMPKAIEWLDARQKLGGCK